jgi:hypothetical protein
MAERLSNIWDAPSDMRTEAIILTQDAERCARLAQEAEQAGEYRHAA